VIFKLILDDNFFVDWEQNEKRNTNKIKKKWNFHKKRLLQDRGIWQVGEPIPEIVRYKIDKAEDSLRRRMRLRIDIQAAKKEYLNATAYQLKLKSSKPTNSNMPSPCNNPSPFFITKLSLRVIFLY